MGILLPIIVPKKWCTYKTQAHYSLLEICYALLHVYTTLAVHGVAYRCGVHINGKHIILPRVCVCFTYALGLHVYSLPHTL
jgi:hypothetical protein